MESLESGLPAQVLVVPLDGSELSHRALAAAAGLAPRLDARVHLVSVASTQEEAALHRREFQDVADLVPGSSCETIMTDGQAVAVDEVAAAILEVVTGAGALVCIGSHGRGRSAGVLGSVAMGVVARVGRPVVVVGPGFDVQTWAVGGPIVACVDGTPASEVVVPIACQWAKALNVSISLVTVAEPIPAPLPGRKWRRLHGPDEDADQYMAALVERHRNAGVPVEGSVVYDPVSVAAGLAEHLAEHRASLVTVATRARTGVSRLVMGSAAAGILHRVPVPVLIVALPPKP
jgi:nucleotide-binding universal stress UspA family protein